MKTATRNALIATVILTGAVISQAHPQKRPGQFPPPMQHQNHPGQQFQQHPQQQTRVRQDPQIKRQKREAKEFMKWQPTDEQLAQMKKQHQNMLRKFDLNEDGKITDQERQIVHHTWKLQQREQRKQRRIEANEPATPTAE